MLRGAVSWEGLFKLIFKFLKSCNLFLFSGSGYGYLNVGRGVFYQRRSHLKWLFSLLFFLSHISSGEDWGLSWGRGFRALWV